MAHVGAAVVVADRQARDDAPIEAAEVLADALAEWFQSLEAVARLRGVQADALPGAVVDGDEDEELPRETLLASFRHHLLLSGGELPDRVESHFSRMIETGVLARA
jgi:hypothetical protein